MPKDPIELLKLIREDKYKFYNRGGNYNEELIAIIKNLDNRLQSIETEK